MYGRRNTGYRIRHLTSMVGPSNSGERSLQQNAIFRRGGTDTAVGPSNDLQFQGPGDSCDICCIYKYAVESAIICTGTR